MSKLITDCMAAPSAPILTSNYDVLARTPAPGGILTTNYEELARRLAASTPRG